LGFDITAHGEDCHELLLIKNERVSVNQTSRSEVARAPSRIPEVNLVVKNSVPL
jgi:hypothetical protein